MIDVKIYYPIENIVNEPMFDRVRIEATWPKRPLLIWVPRKFEEAPTIPKGFGVAYYDLCRARLLMALMPFNVVIAGLIWVYQWVRYGAMYWLHKHSPPNRKDFVKKV